MPEPQNPIDRQPISKSQTHSNSEREIDVKSVYNLSTAFLRNYGFEWSMADAARLRKIIEETKIKLKERFVSGEVQAELYNEVIRIFLDENYGIDMQEYNNVTNADINKRDELLRYLMKKCNKIRKERELIK